MLWGRSRKCVCASLVDFQLQLIEPQDISRLLSLAASSISLLTLPQTDGPNDNLPQGAERSEQFVLEVSEYFERLDVSSRPMHIRTRFSHLVKLVYTRNHSFIPSTHTTIPYRAVCDKCASSRLRTAISRSWPSFLRWG